MKLLFITASRLGDAVLSTGLLNALIEHYPDAEVTIACGPLPAPLFEAWPRIVRIVPLVKGPWAAHWRELWMETVRTRWDLIIDLRDSVVSRLIRSRSRVAWHKTSERLHKVEELSRLIGSAVPAAPRIRLDGQAERQALNILPAGLPYLALAPGANSTGKQWPAAKYWALAKQLTAGDGLMPNARIVVFGDRNDAIRIARPDYPVIDLMGRTDIRLTACCLARASLYVGNDSGLTHLAAASGTPTLALFGPGVAWKYRPWGKRAAYLSRADDPGRDYDLCRDGDDDAAAALMDRITVEDAVEAAALLWQKSWQ